MENYYSRLLSSPLFNDISENDIPDLLTQLNTSVMEYEKGQYIRNAGDPANFIGLVLEGSIQIQSHDYYGNRSIIATFSKGALFAEAFACAYAELLPVDIMANEKSLIMFINRDELFVPCNGCCSCHHILLSNLIKIVARRNMLLNQKLQYTSHKTTSEKIMAYLSDQAVMHKSSEFTIPFDRQGLADYLGVERSAMSAEISKLVKAGCIETKRSRFKLLA